MQEYSRMLLRRTPLQQPTGPLQPCLRTLLASARLLLMSARPLLVATPWMPDVPRLLSLSPVLLCQRLRQPSARINTGGGRKCTFLGIVQKYSRMLLRPTPLQQPGPLQLGPARCEWRPLGRLAHWTRAAATTSETAEQVFLPVLRGSQDERDLGGGPGAGLLDALAPHSTTTAPHRTTLVLTLDAVRDGPLRAPPVPRAPLQPRAAVTKSEISACSFFPRLVP